MTAPQAVAQLARLRSQRTDEALLVLWMAPSRTKPLKGISKTELRRPRWRSCFSAKTRKSASWPKVPGDGRRKSPSAARNSRVCCGPCVGWRGNARLAPRSAVRLILLLGGSAALLRASRHFKILWQLQAVKILRPAGARIIGVNKITAGIEPVRCEDAPVDEVGGL